MWKSARCSVAVGIMGTNVTVPDLVENSGAEAPRHCVHRSGVEATSHEVVARRDGFSSHYSDNSTGLIVLAS